MERNSRALQTLEDLGGRRMGMGGNFSRALLGEEGDLGDFGDKRG